MFVILAPVLKVLAILLDVAWARFRPAQRQARAAARD
jgi:hypothetical protein